MLFDVSPDCIVDGSGFMEAVFPFSGVCSIPHNCHSEGGTRTIMDKHQCVAFSAGEKIVFRHNTTTADLFQRHFPDITKLGLDHLEDVEPKDVLSNLLESNHDCLHMPYLKSDLRSFSKHSERTIDGMYTDEGICLHVTPENPTVNALFEMKVHFQYDTNKE